MAEITYRSPGFFESEIDLSAPTPVAVAGTPAGVVGPSPAGPAFVPTTVTSLAQFTDRFFGNSDVRNNSYFAGQEFFRYGNSLTFLRTLGAGANQTAADIINTQGKGTVKGAGFVISGSAAAGPNIAATSTFTLLNFGSFNDTDNFVIQDAAGVYLKIIFTTSGPASPGAPSYPAAGTGTSGNPYQAEVSIAGGASLTTMTADIITSVNSTTLGASGTGSIGITASSVTATSLLLTQDTAGYAGNTTVTRSGGLSPFAITTPDFTGGFTDIRHQGAVQFLVARHNVSTNADYAYPIFVDNDSFNVSPGGGTANIVRGVILFATGTRGQVLSYNENYSPSSVVDDAATIQSTSTSPDYKTFKIVISGSGASFGSDDGYNGIKIYTASLDPANSNYISNVLNTSPELFQQKQHLLYLDYPIEDSIASVSTVANSVAILSGSSNTSPNSGDSTLTFLNAFGKFDARYSPARTTKFISQPYGDKEYDLFHFETISDGAVANDLFKVTISNLRRSTDPANPYGTFSVQVRDFYDTDGSPVVYEQFSGCTLNPADPNYIARKIGDRKVFFNFDAVNVLDKNFVSTGTYPNMSTRIRVIMSSEVTNNEIPKDALPFGFRGLPALKFTAGLTDNDVPALSNRESGILPTAVQFLTSSIQPPIPMRYKVTTGETDSTPAYQGQAGITEAANASLSWGVKFEKVQDLLNPNASTELNPYVVNVSKFSGIQKLDMLYTGSSADSFGNNKFSLSKVAFYNSKGAGTALNAAVTNLTGTVGQHMVEAIYIRNAVPDASDGTVSDSSISGRLTLGTLALIPSASIFNRFSQFTKFTNFFYGGFDGLNILDVDMASMNDKSTSSETGGKAISNPNIGLNIFANNFASGDNNAIVSSYKTAASIITNSAAANVNIITVPGIRDASITNTFASNTQTYARAIYLMDIPAYTDAGVRIFDNTTLPDVNYTINRFTARNINNNYVATYFPDASINYDASPGAAVGVPQKVRVPASIIALGALAQNDSKAYPWYAPAGFNRAALTSVVNLAVRLSSSDRDSLYDARINPITSFPGLGFVIYGQKTLQIARSALDRVNVRRLLIELARVVTAVGLRFVFEPNTAATRAQFVSQLTPRLATIQAQSGIDSYRIIMDTSNNTQQVIEANRLVGTIVIVPTRAVEYIAIDFIITNAGVEFV